MSNKDHIDKLIAIHKRNLQEFEKQKASLGLHTPPYILQGIEDSKEKIQELTASVKGKSLPQDAGAIDLPFVVVAMTREEAEKLTSGTIFDDSEVAPIERERFEAFRGALKEHGISDLLSCYGESRDEWRPLTARTTIRDIIEGVVDRLNKDRQKRNLPVIRPHHFSTELLPPDHEWRGGTWDQLEKLGCVLIVDAISMFHPLLRQTFLQCQFVGSSFGAGGRISLVVVSPLSSNTLKVNQLLEKELCSRIMRRAFDRFDTYLDPFCEFGVGDPRHLRRWLFSILPKTAKAVQEGGMSPEAREAMRRELGEPTGIGHVAIGRGV